VIREPQKHLTAGRGAAGLEKTEVARGDFGFTGKIELTKAPALAPLAQKRAYRSHRCRHISTLPAR